MAAPDLSVIIPVGPDEHSWRSLVTCIPPDWQVIVAATESRPEHASDRIHWHHGPRGRGRQLNAGAALSQAKWLWFIHADSQLQATDFRAVAAWCQQCRGGLGYLNLAFLNDGPCLARLNAIGANWRSRLFGLPYGDQALCVTAADFQRLGGFREDLKRGEDLDFVVRARAAGLRASRIPGLIRTSARRYREQGWLRTTWQHQRHAWRLIRQARSSATRPENP